MPKQEKPEKIYLVSVDVTGYAMTEGESLVKKFENHIYRFKCQEDIDFFLSNLKAFLDPAPSKKVKRT